jgi:hypothetical protein
MGTLAGGADFPSSDEPGLAGAAAERAPDGAAFDSAAFGRCCDGSLDSREGAALALLCFCSEGVLAAPGWAVAMGEGNAGTGVSGGVTAGGTWEIAAGG